VRGRSCCEACGSGRIVGLGEDVTETLAVIPRSWKVNRAGFPGGSNV